MKNLIFKGFLFSLALFISANVVCADVTVTDDIPKKINVQGKITTDSGQPMSGSKDITLTITDKDSHSFSKTVSVTLDSDGLYNADFDFTGKNINFNGPCSFAVQANGVTSVSRDISSVPTAFYSSSSTYSLVLDPVNGMKLVDGNFSPTNTYTIKVATANYAKKMSTNSDNGYVWGMTSNTEQGWISPGSLGIATASISTLGGIKLANSNTGLSSNISSDSILKVQLDTNAGLKIDNSNKVTIDPATDAKFGVVKVTNGNGLSIGSTGADKGKISMALANTNNKPGAVKVSAGKGLTYDSSSGTISITTDNNPTASSENLLTSGAIYTAIETATAGIVTVDATQTLTNKTIDLDSNTISNIETDNFKSGVIVTTIRAIESASDNSVPTEKAVRTEINKKQDILEVGYGDTTNPYTSKTKNYVLAGPVSGSNAAPSFRTLDKLDIPLASEAEAKDGETTSLVTTGEKYIWNRKQNALTEQTAYSSKGSSTKVPKITTNDLGQVTLIEEVTITDTKNTAGSTATTSKIYLVGATSQTDSAQTYSRSSVFIDGSGRLNSAAPDTSANDNTVATTQWIKGKNYLTSHQAIKVLNTNNTDAQTASENESITGNGTINLHKIAKTGNYNDLTNTPTIPTTTSSLTSGSSAALTSGGAYSNLVSAISSVSGSANKIKITKAGQNDEITINNVSNATTATKLGSGESGFDDSNISDGKVWVKDNAGKQGWVDLKNAGGYTVGVGADLAEIYRSKESLQPGDVVSIDTTRDDAIVKTKVAEDTLVAGVISTDPGLLLNSAEKGYKLALVGKVPTKVCNEGGEIKRGDLLVSASLAGYAKKAGENPKAGTVIGKALENFSSKRGTILVLVNLQ